MTTATELLTNICEKYIIYLLEEIDEDQLVLRKIRDGDWVSEEERYKWIISVLTHYLILGSHDSDGISINEWILSTESQIFQELEKEEYREEMRQIRKRLVIGNANINLLMYNFYSKLLYSKKDEDLLKYINMLCPEFSPK
jgi:hypothetical protein